MILSSSHIPSSFRTHTHTHSGVLFRNNFARAGNGGAIYVLFSSIFTLGSSAIFEFNSASAGGAIGVYAGTLNLGDYTVVRSNQAIGGNGGGFWVGAGGRVVVTSNFSATNNSAVAGVGGAMFVGGASSVVFNA